jgi:flagellar secretion chaperone FliS
MYQKVVDSKVVDSYTQTNFTTANPLKLVIMCYEGAISSLKLARKLYAAKDYEGKAKALQKSFDIISEINSSLDLERGGDIARNLRSLYLYMIKTLTEADLKRDLGMFDEVIRILTELEAAWREIAYGSAVASSQPASCGITTAGVKTAALSQAWCV